MLYIMSCDCKTQSISVYITIDVVEIVDKRNGIFSVNVDRCVEYFSSRATSYELTEYIQAVALSMNPKLVLYTSY